MFKFAIKFLPSFKKTSMRENRSGWKGHGMKTLL